MLTSLPNMLTLSRIAVIPAIVALFYVEGDFVRWIVFGLFVLACVTDFVDGYAARQMNQISRLGRFLDPVADKLLVASIILMLVATGDLAGLNVIPGLIILVREITVSGLREFLAELKVGMPVSRLAKWKTFIQMTALSILVIGNASPEGWPVHAAGIVLIWLAAVLTVITGLDYLRAGLKHMMQDSPAE